MPKVYYNDKEIGTLITREEFIKLDPGTVYDNLTYAGCSEADVVIFRRPTGEIAVEDADSVEVGLSAEMIAAVEADTHLPVPPQFETREEWIAWLKETNL
jgi:hypothetical protein